MIEYTEIDAPPIELAADYEVTLTLDGPGKLSLRYLLFDTASGEIIQQGDADALDANWFAIRLTAETTAELELGIYELVLVAYSDELARMAERRIELEADFTIIEEEPAPAEESKTETESSESSEAAADKEESESETATDTETKSDAAESDTASDSEAAAESDAAAETEAAAQEPAEEPFGGLPVNVIVAALAVIVVGGLIFARRRR